MNLSPVYIRAEEQEILACTGYAGRGGCDRRYAVVASFCNNFKQILDIGCAGYEPVVIHATHALDVSPLAEKLLRARGWGGHFYVGTCTNLPWPNKSFECGVLCEVVEHLPTGNDAVRAVKELDRVCRSWILTTPIKLTHRPEHKRVLTDEDIDFLCRKTGAKSKKHPDCFVVWKGDHDPDF